eukprot:7384076-Prymnesium_polylepis.1
MTLRAHPRAHRGLCSLASHVCYVYVRHVCVARAQLEHRGAEVEALHEAEAALRSELQAKRLRVGAAEEGTERERARVERLEREVGEAERERGAAERALVAERARAVEAEGVLSELRATLSAARDDAARAVARASLVEGSAESTAECRALRVERHVLQQELQAADLRSATDSMVRSARGFGPSVAALQDEICLLYTSDAADDM